MTTRSEPITTSTRTEVQSEEAEKLLNSFNINIQTISASAPVPLLPIIPLIMPTNYAHSVLSNNSKVLQNSNISSLSLNDNSHSHPGVVTQQFHSAEAPTQGVIIMSHNPL